MAVPRLFSVDGSPNRQQLIEDRAQLGGAFEVRETSADEIDIDRPGDLARLMTGRAPCFRPHTLSCVLMMSQRLLHARIMNKALRSRKALWGIVDNLRSDTGGTLKKMGEPQAAVRW